MNLGTALAVAVAAASVLVTWLVGARRLGIERELADLAAVRQVLDDAAVTLHNAAILAEQTRGGTFEYLFRPDQSKWDDMDAAIKAENQRLRVLAERLRVRFGEGHPIVGSFDATSKALMDCWGVLFGALLSFPREDTRTKQEKDERRSELLDEYDAGLTDIDDQRKTFIAAAHSAAGAKLPRQATVN